MLEQEVEIYILFHLPYEFSIVASSPDFYQ